MVRLSHALAFALCALSSSRAQIPSPTVDFGRGAYGILRRQDSETVQSPPSQTPVLFFNTINNMTTCRSSIISWVYNGPQNVIMQLTVTNAGVPQESLTATPSTSSTPLASRGYSDPSPHGKRALPDISLLLSNQIDPNKSFFWPNVNVPSGSYVLQASFPSLNFVRRSAVFYVFQGPDTTCVIDVATSTSSSSTSTPGSSSITSPPASSGTSPVTGVSGSKSLDPGTIVGIVLGGLALLMGFGAAYFFMHRSRRGSKSHSGHGFSHGWNGLNSTDSRTALGGNFTSNNKRPNPRSSTQTQTIRSRRYSASSPTVVIGPGPYPSEEKVGAGRYSRKNSLVASADDHDRGLDRDQAMALAALPTLHNQALRNGSSAIPAHGRRGSIDSRARSSSSEFGVSRAPSASATSVTPHTTPMTGDSRQQTHNSPPSPVSPSSAESRKAKRASLGGLKRKPVPQYDPNELPAPVPTPSPAPHSQYQSSVSSSPIPMSVLDSQSHNSSHPGYPPTHHPHLHQPQPQAPLSSSPHSGGLIGHYTTRNHSMNASSRSDIDDASDLTHKTSFGTGGLGGGGYPQPQVHYLMPDMPPGAHMQSS